MAFRIAVVMALVACVPWLMFMGAGPLTTDIVLSNPTHLLPLGGDGWIDFAATWQQARCGRRILLLEDSGGNLVRLGIVPPRHELERKLLVDKGVPAGAIEVVRRDGDPEWADDLHSWIGDHPSARVLVVASEFRTRLVALELRRARRHDELPRRSTTGVHGLSDRRFGRNDWWRSRAGASTFASAWLDLIHAILMGPPRPDDYPPWDAVAYERELVLRTGNER